MSGLCLTAGGARRSATPLLVAGTGLACVATGCVPWVGPVQVRIETGGVRYDDFVLEPAKKYGRVHSADVVPLESRVVATEEDITLPRSSKGFNFSSYVVSVYHPEFVYAWTGEPKGFGGAIELSPLRPQKWSDYLEEQGQASLSMVEGHLDRIELSYLPVFEAGEARRRLQRYLPGLRELVERAEWSSGDSSRWTDEAEARRELEKKLEAISRLMR